MEIVTLGIDLARNIFVLHGVDTAGKFVLQRPTVKRYQPLMRDALRRFAEHEMKAIVSGLVESQRKQKAQKQQPTKTIPPKVKKAA